MYVFLSLSFILLILAQADPLYKKVVHTTDPQALCLDGTPPFLYYHQGSLSNKFLVFFNGGALCHGMSLEETISDCYNRSKTKLGSSNGWADTMTGQGILSTDQSISDFANWTKIVIGYCDGSLHQGYRQVPISYKGQKLYFRGAVNTRSHFKWIINKFPAFKNADQVVITGASAGAIASYQWTNYVRTLVSNSSNVITVADSGAFIISKTYEKGIDYVLTIFMNMFKLANIEQKTPLELCNAKYKDEEYKCLFIQYAWTSLLSRTLIINSQYDSENIRSHLQMNCLVKGSTQFTLTNCTQSQINFIEDYRTKFKDFMEYFMMYSKNSAWTIGCSQHVYSPRNALYNADTERVPAKTGLTVKQALNLFVFEKQRVHSEEIQPWPSNTGCAK